MDGWASYPVAWVPLAAAHMDAPGLRRFVFQLGVTLTVLPLRACSWLLTTTLERSCAALSALGVVAAKRKAKVPQQFPGPG